MYDNSMFVEPCPRFAKVLPRLYPSLGKAARLRERVPGWSENQAVPLRLLRLPHEMVGGGIFLRKAV